jgi:DNA invertase Pin-like site-specific DNA recombinase
MAGLADGEKSAVPWAVIASPENETEEGLAMTVPRWSERCRAHRTGLNMIDKRAKRNVVRAAQYVRMSTEHQQYSTDNQKDAIREYADKKGMEIVRTYTDEGKSGLRLHGRDALRRLLEDVQNGDADFEVILVYDVSRWGRFQDADEGAYYEYICTRADIALEYCAEQFKNDGSPVSTIVKGVKRAMAGEYSRELSAKVFKGQCRLIELGFRQGGPAGYGLRRMLVDIEGNSKGILDAGEQKSIQTDRVILVPGPREEVETVRRIYRLFSHHDKSEAEIAAILNQEKIPTDLGRPWRRETVRGVIMNEKYIGNNVYNRSSGKLKGRRVENPPEMWIRANGAFEAIVDPELFRAAWEGIIRRNQRFSDQEMLDMIQALYKKEGRLSGLLIDEAESIPSSSVYRRRFGSLPKVYRLIGYKPDHDLEYIEINRQLRRKHAEVVEDVVVNIESLGGTVERGERTDLLLVNREFSTSVVIARCRKTAEYRFRWHIRLDIGLAPDITVAVRMNHGNKEPLDYYLLPQMDLANLKIGSRGLCMAYDNELMLDIYRFEDLKFFFGMAERMKIGAQA